MGERSIVYWCSDSDKHLCGYCKNENGTVSHGMWAKLLTVEDYQHLIDRGWRRSGHYCYKPIMDQICCPMYTIKCDALNFQLSKSQKKVIKKFNRFLHDGILKTASVPDIDQPPETVPVLAHQIPGHFKNLESSDSVMLETGKNASDFDVKTNLQNDDNSERASVSEALRKEGGATLNPKSGLGPDPSRPASKKAKILRWERKQEKLLKMGKRLNRKPVPVMQKSLEEFLDDQMSGSKHKFTITIEQIHEQHKYFRLTANLFRKYQIYVHDDSPSECDENQFTSFLLDTPLQTVRFTRDSLVGFGSFHQLYWLDDKLIAVGVIDILPKCVSAVYFFYDPDYRDLTLGTYGSLCEIALARSLHQSMPSIDKYYMGFYIHSCPKMRYKGKLTPSFLLCPEKYHWVPIEQCLSKLDVSKYSRLEDNDDHVDEDLCSLKDIDEIKVLYDRKIVSFKHYKRHYNGQDLFNKIGQLVGRRCCKSMIFITDY